MSWYRDPKTLDIGAHLLLMLVALLVVVVCYAGTISSWNGWVGGLAMFAVIYVVAAAVLLVRRGRWHRASIDLDFTCSIFAFILLAYSFQAVTFESRQLPAIYASEPYLTLFRFALLAFAVLGLAAAALTEVRVHGRFDLRSFLREATS